VKARGKGIVGAANVDQKLNSLLKARVDAAKTEVDGRWKEYKANPDYLNASYLNSSRRLCEAERDLSPTTADQVAACESHQRRMQLAYLLTSRRYNTGKFASEDLALADSCRLDAEIGVERLKADNIGQEIKSLLKERLDAVNTEAQARSEEYRAGRGTLDMLLNAYVRLFQAERDLSSTTPGQVAAWERHWQRMREVYLITLARYEAGRISVQDFAQSHFCRLEADIGLERARTQLRQRK
jgi:hypothetical protein